MANELYETVLRGVLDGDKKRFYYLLEHLDRDSFEDEHLDLFKIMAAVFEQTSEVLNSAALDKILPRTGLPVERIAPISALWTRLSERGSIAEVDFKASISLILDEIKKRKLGEALTGSFEILTKGTTDEKTKELKEGANDAIDFLREKLADVEDVGSEQLPEFNIRTMKADILEKFYEENSSSRIGTGIRPLDEMTGGGVGLGELWLPMAGTGVGKSMICTNIAQHFMVTGHNSIYFTTETLFRQIRQRIMVRHSREKKFGLHRGLSSRRIDDHRPSNPVLSEEEENTWLSVIDDFTGNASYGQLIVVQVPDSTKISTLESKLYRWHQQFPIDACFIDSPDMLYPEFRRSDERHNLNEVVNRCKSLAVGFDNGRGMRVIAPWQASRAGQTEAQNTGRYTKTALSDTAMAEKRADLVLGLLEDNTQPTKLFAQTLKFREYAPKDFELEVDYDHAYIGSDNSLSGASEIGFAGLM